MSSLQNVEANHQRLFSLTLIHFGRIRHFASFGFNLQNFLRAFWYTFELKTSLVIRSRVQVQRQILHMRTSDGNFARPNDDTLQVADCSAVDCERYADRL